MGSRKTKVIVAMSGGVDSSVAAALLVGQGFEVVGVTLNVWPEEDDQGISERPDACCSLSAVWDARRVADKLGIAHYTLNFRDVFKAKVIGDFAAEYRRGRTPNPCIRCNEHVKFDALLERTKGLDAEFLATGHYARIEHDRQRARYLLRKGRDQHKDQSYVLYVLSQAVLARTMLPLGELTKQDTRRLAAELGLSTAHKAESQEICFVQDNDYARFLRDYDDKRPETGPILDAGGQVIGRHCGVANFTIGQRRGLGLAGGVARYVTAIDAEHNAVVVGAESELYEHCLIAESVNLVGEPDLRVPKRVSARVRYRAIDMLAETMLLADGRLYVRFDEPQRAITPGQAVVCYDGDSVVAGGTIAAVGIEAEHTRQAVSG